MVSFWTAPTYFFLPSYTASFCLSQNPSSETLISQSLFWNLKITRLCLSQILTLSSLNPLSLAPSHRRSSSSLPRAVAPSQLILSPSRRRTSHFVAQSLSRRTSQLSLSPASPSQRSLDRSSLIAVAAQPRYFIYGITNTKDSELQ